MSNPIIEYPDSPSNAVVPYTESRVSRNDRGRRNHDMSYLEFIDQPGIVTGKLYYRIRHN